MSKVSKVIFGKNETGGTAVMDAAPPAPAQTAAVAVRESMPVSAYADTDDTIGMEDVTLPRLNIVQKVGELSTLFDGGALILSGDMELDRPVRLIVMGFQARRYCEKVQGGARGNIFDTVEEVQKVGGTLDYNEAKAKGTPWYQALETALVMIEKPEKADPMRFPHELDGKRYAVALWSLKGTGFTHGAKKIFTEKKLGSLRGKPYRAGVWTLDTKLEKNQSNYYYIPVLKLVAETTPEWQALTRELLGF